MSKSWTPEEIKAASEAMKKAGHLSYEEFCRELERQLSQQKPEKPEK